MLAISAIYFSKGNRDNLRNSVLYPMKQLLEEPCSWESYDVIFGLQKEYSTKYLNQYERNIIDDLLKSYKVICTYDYEQVSAGVLFEYFCRKLEEIGVDTKPVPIYMYEELVDVDYPEGLTYIRDELAKILYKYPPELDETKCKEAVTKLFKSYAKTCYGKEVTVWFDEYKNIKKKFLEMKVFNQ